MAAEPERALFGSYPTRNMVSDETGLPTKWDVKTGMNVKWSQASGSQTYAGPVVADGKVFIGTNNEAVRNPKLKGDKGVVMAFRASDGQFLWQMVTDKLPSGRVNDWPQQGVCSTPFVEGKRLYYTSNQARIVCLDTEGFRDGKNDGITTEKYKDEIDGDVIWEFDMMGEADVFPHNLAASSPMVVGDLVVVPYGFKSMQQFRNWRWYKGLGGGPIVDLGSHQIDIFNWFLGGAPSHVMASGGNDYHDRATHEWYDTVMAIYEYDTKAGPARAYYQTQTTNGSQGYFENGPTMSASVTGVCSVPGVPSLGMPSAPTLDVYTTRGTPAWPAASSTDRVPSTLAR